MTRLKSCPRQCPPERQSAWVTYLPGIAIAVALACAAPSIRAENRDTNGSVRYPHADQGAGRHLDISSPVTYDASVRERDIAPWVNRLSYCRGVTMAQDTSPQVTADPVPVTLLVGFLGSGKTTLANRILSEQHDQRIAVIVNEFGDVGIDGQLIVGVDDNVIELSNGCLCCTVQGDLADTLRQLLVRRRQTGDAKPFERIMIEASGLASPGPVLQGMLVDPSLNAQVQVDGVITMAHAKHIVQQLEDHPEASEQVAYADHIILNHCDQCDGDELAAAEAAIHACNQQADIERATRAEVDVVRVLNKQTWDSARVKAALEHGAVCGDHAHDPDHAQ